jgi:hypothetical protein
MARDACRLCTSLPSLRGRKSKPFLGPLIEILGGSLAIPTASILSCSATADSKKDNGSSDHSNMQIQFHGSP